jgi:4-hydroxybenzoate polyprenyltransferase
VATPRLRPTGFFPSVAALIGSSHPVPSVVVASLTTTFAWSVGLAPWQVVVVFIAMITNQFGIGLGNDWLDYHQDREVNRGDKPLAKGKVSPVVARNTAIGLGVAALGASALLGLVPLVAMTVMLLAGWWYNLHAKGHWSSVASYLLGFSLLPVFPLLAKTPPETPPWWVVVVAALLGASAHFANALPDLITDRHHGIRGLPQRLGPRWSGVVLAGGVMAATMIITLAAAALPGWLRVTTASLALGAAVTASVLAFRPTPPRVIFPLVMSSAVVCVVAIVIDLRAS